MVRVIATDRINGRAAMISMVPVGVVNSTPILPPPEGIIPEDVLAHEAVSIANAAERVRVTQLEGNTPSTSPADDDVVTMAMITRDGGHLFNSIEYIDFSVTYNGTVLGSALGYIQRLGNVATLSWGMFELVGRGTVAHMVLPISAQRMWIKRGQTCSGNMLTTPTILVGTDATRGRLTIYQEYYVTIYADEESGVFTNGVTYYIGAGSFSYPCFV